MEFESLDAPAEIDLNSDNYTFARQLYNITYVNTIEFRIGFFFTFAVLQ